MDAGALWKRTLAALVAHFALLALWPIARAGYAPAFRSLAQLAVAVADPLPGAIDASFEPGSGGLLAEDLVKMDTVVSLRHRDLEGGAATFGASSFYHGYLPTCVLLALFAAATPLPWRARRAPLCWALALLHLFIASRCLVAVYYAYSKCSIDGRPVLDFLPATLRALHLAKHFCWEEMFANYLAPLLIWGLCVFGPRPSAGGRA